MTGTIFSLTGEQFAGRQAPYSVNYYLYYMHLKRKIEQVVDVVSYSINLETTDNSTGTVTIAGDLDGDYSQCFIEIEGFDMPFAITDKTSVQQHLSTLTVGDSCSMFNGVVHQYDIGDDDDPNPIYLNDVYQELFGTSGTGWSPTGGTSSRGDVTVGNHDVFVSHRTAHFFNTAAITLDNTIDISSLVTDGYLDAGSLMRYICSIGYRLTMSGIAQGLYQYYVTTPNTQDDLRYNLIPVWYYDKCMGFALTAMSQVVQPIYFEDGHNFLTSSTITEDKVTNVCIWSGGDGGTVASQSIYGLDTDGTAKIGQSDIIGKTSFYATTEALTSSERLAKAQEIFDTNTTSHSVVFRSDKDLHIGQPVKLMLSTGALDSAISKVTVSSDNKLKEYTCGSLPDNASAQLKASSWTYGKRLPINPYKGQLVMI